MTLTLLVAALLGCRTAEPPPPPPIEEPVVSSVEPHMQEQLRRIAVARDALLFGDLEAASKEMTWLASHELPSDMPEGSRPYLERMRAAARTAGYVNTPKGVGRGVASAAFACGECHLDLVGGVRIHQSPPPHPSAGLVAEMARHVWAAEKMWNGLIGPTPGAWAEAAELLAQAPLYAAPEGKVMSEEALTFSRKVADLGVSTLTAASPSERIDLYGEFLGTCAGCHAATEAKPTP